MDHTVEDIDKLSPQKLTGVFSRSPVMKALGIAVVLHIVVIGGTSLRYLYRSLIATPPPEVEATETAEADVEEAADPQEAADAQEGTAAAPAAAAAAARPAGSPAEPRPDAPVVRRVTDSASPDELPAMPDDLGLRLEDTRF